MSYVLYDVLYGLDIAAHLVLVGLLVFLCFRTKSKGLILISAVLLMNELSGLIFEQVVQSDWWRWEPGKTIEEGILGMSDVEFLVTVAMVKSLLYKGLCLLGVFLIYKEWRQGKFRLPQPEHQKELAA